MIALASLLRSRLANADGAKSSGHEGRERGYDHCFRVSQKWGIRLTQVAPISCGRPLFACGHVLTDCRCHIGSIATSRFRLRAHDPLWAVQHGQIRSTRFSRGEPCLEFSERSWIPIHAGHHHMLCALASTGYPLPKILVRFRVGNSNRIPRTDAIDTSCAGGLGDCIIREQPLQFLDLRSTHRRLMPHVLGRS